MELKIEETLAFGSFCAGALAGGGVVVMGQSALAGAAMVVTGMMLMALNVYQFMNLRKPKAEIVESEKMAG